MNPHKLTLKAFLLLIFVFLAAEMSFPVTGGRRGIVVDERLAALRETPQLDGRLVRRLSRGRIVAIRGSRTTPEGVVFLRVNVTSRTRGWIQREAIASPARSGDDGRLLDLIRASHGFDLIIRARIFLDHFSRSRLHPGVLLLLGDAAEEQAARLSRDAAKRLNVTTTSAPLFTYFLNYSGLDRYNRQRVGFVFDPVTKRFHYDGAAWRQLVRLYPNTPEAVKARERLAELQRGFTQIGKLNQYPKICGPPAFLALNSQKFVRRDVNKPSNLPFRGCRRRRTTGAGCSKTFATREK